MSFEEYLNDMMREEPCNPLPYSMDYIKQAISHSDNIHYGKKMALAFVESIEPYIYVTKEHFTEYGYDVTISEDGLLTLNFQDGSSLAFDEGKQSFKLFNFK